RSRRKQQKLIKGCRPLVVAVHRLEAEAKRIEAGLEVLLSERAPGLGKLDGAKNRRFLQLAVVHAFLDFFRAGLDRDFLAEPDLAEELALFVHELHRLVT